DWSSDVCSSDLEQLEKLIGGVFESALNKNKMKILKFGGKSLANGQGINNVVEIINRSVQNQERIAVVVSARNNATNELENILETAAAKQDYLHLLDAFKKYQLQDYQFVDLSEEFGKLEKRFSGVYLLGDFSHKIKDEVLAQGVRILAKLLTQVLNTSGIQANFTDSRALIVTDEKFGDAQPLEKASKAKVLK